MSTSVFKEVGQVLDLYKDVGDKARFVGTLGQEARRMLWVLWIGDLRWGLWDGREGDCCRDPSMEEAS